MTVTPCRRCSIATSKLAKIGLHTRSHRWRQQPYEHGAEEPSPTGESVSIELDEPPPTTLKVTRVAKPDRGLDTPAVV